jgi:hypothetical protein
MPMSYFSSAVMPPQAENATRFSELSTMRKEGLFVDALRREFSFIRNIEVLVGPGGPGLHVTLDNLEPKMPLGIVSGGINKLAGILLAIVSRPQGVILIDEIENGFYFDRLETIWSSILSLCKEANAQVFASTHSNECLSSLQKTAEGHESDFALIRTDRIKGKCEARVFPGRQLSRAIEQGIEVR